MDARLANADFPAFLFQAFSPTTADMLLAQMPPLRDYMPMAHPDALVEDQPTRFAIPLKSGAPVCPTWLDLAHFLNGDLIRQYISTALGIPESVAVFPAVALLRDLPGYKIRIHPDSKRKIAIMQVYLASNTATADIGARFYRPDGAGFIQTDACPYLPGAGYFFRRTESSWHGVNATTEQDGERNSLMLIYFDSPKVSFS